MVVFLPVRAGLCAQRMVLTAGPFGEMAPLMLYCE